MEGSLLSVMVVESHALLADSLAAGLREQGMPDVDVLCCGATSAEVLAGLGETAPDVVVLGLHGGHAPHGLLCALRERGTRVFVVTGGDDPALLASCLEDGATGVFTTRQPLAELAGYIVDAARGATLLSPVARTELVGLLRDRRCDRRRSLELFQTLTASEEAVLEDLARGRAPDEIARERYVAVSTVRSQIRSILSKLGVNSQLAAVTLAFRSGWPRLREMA